MANVVKDYTLQIIKGGKRLDGRNFEEYREPITVEYGISERSSEGSAKVTIGDTIVVAGVKMGIGTPFPDTPDEGALMVNVELTPLASPDFELGPPSIESIELARVVDRGIRESKLIDVKKLCVTEGEKVWMVFIDIYPLNDAGNLFDACALAAIAALKNAKFPKFDGEKVDYKEHEGPLPLTKEPIGVTIWKIGKSLIADPTLDEEQIMDARLTAWMDEKNAIIYALQKGGDSKLTIEDVEAMIALAKKKIPELRKAL